MDPSLQNLQERLHHRIDESAERLIALSRRIHAHPEIAMEEHQACAWLSEELAQEGFVVEKGVAGMDTAFRATARGRRDRPAVAILAEYDALPGIGHACGHNLIAGATIGAGIGLRAILSELDGTVIILGTPAEEADGGKAIMIEQGGVDDIDVAMMIHPSGNTFTARESLAIVSLDVTFHGKAAHAAACPDQGINALDAVIQTFNAINALRQQLPEDVRIHGIITEGGRASNIIPDRASAKLGVRTLNQAFLSTLVEKVEACAKSAALATGATLDIHRGEMNYAAIKINRPLAEAMGRNMKALGLSIDDPPRRGRMGSTDMGNVSRVIPAAHPYIAIGPPDIAGHSEVFREMSLSDRGHQAMLLGAKILAMTALDLFTDPTLMEAVRRDFENHP